MTDKELEDKIKTLLGGVPSMIRSQVQEKVDFYISKKPLFTNDEIYQEAHDLVELSMLAYRDARSYLGLYNRKFSEHKLHESIVKIMKLKKMNEESLYSLARINFDLNGLKALNDLGGHDAGNKGLELFADVLKEGETSNWLRSHDIKVVVSAEGGDEFGMLLISKIDLRPLKQELVDRYVLEVRKVDASKFIDFSDPTVRQNLKLLHISDDVPEDFKFELSTSVGICLLGEALSVTDVSSSGATYDEVIHKVVEKMFEMADKRSMVHKSAYKEQLDQTNPILSGLYSRMSREVIHLEKELIKRSEKIIQLEARLSHEKEKNQRLEKDV